MRRVSVQRSDVNRLLGIPKNLSYRILAPRMCGTVLVSDVESAMNGSAFNGARFDYERDSASLLDIRGVCDLTGLRPRAARRMVKSLPHFKLTTKVVLVKACDVVRRMERRAS